MPKEIIDYSQTTIYKIFCKDEQITDIYVGHTTNFAKRKYQHKSACNRGDKLKLYETIRKNGGWDNWNIYEIAKYNCNDNTEARIKEQYHYELLKSTLNSVSPYKDKTKYFCEKCNIYCENEVSYNKHIQMNKHKEDWISKKLLDKYQCELCNYTCCYLSDWNKHITTRKHINNKNDPLEEIEKIEEIEELQLFEKNVKISQCEHCNKEFKTNAGLWKHKNKGSCLKIHDKATENNEIITMLLKQNSELIKGQSEMIKEHSDIKNLILEICKNGINNSTSDSHNTTNTTTTTTNSHNKAFNIQFYLNETCKNAMNMSDFIESINLQLSDLISVGELGYVDGISKIIIDELNKLDSTKRPVNCTDKKRETIYIKDDDKWDKDEENKKLTKAVKRVAFKNTKLFPTYKEKYPEYSNAESCHSDKYSKIVIESLKDDRENNDKVIKNISKVTTIKEK